MPVRFQVDPDFYDHPKVLGLSDAAIALWVRAGSYSAAKTSDGFIAEHVLVLLSKTPMEAAEELRRRGLWHKARGGYRFHQWEARNLLRERIEADKEADRNRKKRDRAAKNNSASDTRADGETNTRRAGSNGNPQASTGNVRPESERTPEGIPEDSGRIPGSSVSVSVSVSESVSGSGRGDDSGDSAAPAGAGHKPPTRCPDHTDDPKPPPCGRCKEARERAEDWQRQHDAANRAAAAEAAAARTAELEQRAEVNRAAIAACTRCDQHGQVDGTPCTHEPGKADRARRGAALVRAAVAKVGSP